MEWWFRIILSLFGAKLRKLISSSTTSWLPWLLPELLHKLFNEMSESHLVKLLISASIVTWLSTWGDGLWKQSHTESLWTHGMSCWHILSVDNLISLVSSNELEFDELSATKDCLLFFNNVSMLQQVQNKMHLKQYNYIRGNILNIHVSYVNLCIGKSAHYYQIFIFNIFRNLFFKLSIIVKLQRRVLNYRNVNEITVIQSIILDF